MPALLLLLLSPSLPGCPGLIEVSFQPVHNFCCSHLRGELHFQFPLQVLALKLLVLAHIGTDLNSIRDQVRLFQKARQPTILRICFCWSNKPRPKSSTPALLLTTVRSLRNARSQVRPQIIRCLFSLTLPEIVNDLIKRGKAQSLTLPPT